MLNLNNNYATRPIAAATIGSNFGGPLTMVCTFRTKATMPQGGIYVAGSTAISQCTGIKIGPSSTLEAGMLTVVGTMATLLTLAPDTVYTVVLTRDNAGNTSASVNGGAPVDKSVSAGAVTYDYLGVGTFRANGVMTATAVVDVAHCALYRRTLTTEEIAAYHAKNLAGIAATNRFDYHSLISDLDSDAGGTAMVMNTGSPAFDGYDPFAALYSLNSINGGNPVIPGQPFTWVATGFTPTSGTIGGIDLSGVSLSGATAPSYVDGGPILLPGTRTVTAIDGSATASANATVGVIPGYTYTVLEPGFDEGNYSVVQNAGASAGWVVIHPDTDVVGTDALLKTNAEGSRTYWLGDPVSGLGYSYLVTTGVGDDGNEFVRVRRLRGDPVEFKKVLARKVTGIKP